MIYLMAPYTHKDPERQTARAAVASLVAGRLMQQFPYDWVFSPISHGHAVAQFLPPAVRDDHKFWMAQCQNTLRDADRVFLLPSHGWQDSKGIALETEWCQDMGKNIIPLTGPQWFRKQAHNYAWDMALSQELHWLGTYQAAHLPLCQRYGVQRYDLDNADVTIHLVKEEQ